MRLVNTANGVEVSVSEERGQELLSDGSWERLDTEAKPAGRSRRAKTEPEE